MRQNQLLVEKSVDEKEDFSLKEKLPSIYLNSNNDLKMSLEQDKQKIIEMPVKE